MAPIEIRLTQAEAETYIALCNHPDGATDEKWYTWLEGYRQRQLLPILPPWKNKSGSIVSDKNAQVRVGRLNRKLTPLRQAGLHTFLVQVKNRRRYVEAAKSMTVKHRDRNA